MTTLKETPVKNSNAYNIFEMCIEIMVHPAFDRLSLFSIYSISEMTLDGTGESWLLIINATHQVPENLIST